MAVNIPNGNKTHQHVSFQGPQNYPKLGYFGMKTNHLATLLLTGTATFGFISSGSNRFNCNRFLSACRRRYVHC
jgi:hypothetical protein